MILEYTLEEKDFLTHQLFLASRSDQIKKRRQRSRIIVSLAYIVFGGLFFNDGNYFGAFGFLLFAIVWFFLYPVWETKRYIKHYQKFVQEHLKERFDRKVTLELNKDFLLGKDIGSESKMVASEVLDVNEIPGMFVIRLKGGLAFVIPKDKIADVEKVRNELKELASIWKTNYSSEDNWVWK